jgi:ribonuclease D
VVLTSPDDVQQLCERIKSSGIVAIDTEFHGERVYQPRLFLVQLAVPAQPGGNAELFAIDPLECTDLSALMNILAREDVETIVHSGSIDLSILFRQYGLIPSSVFDTQVAAGFVGCSYPMGLSKLIQVFLGKNLRKSQTLSDWSQRPLSPKQLEYAFDDVRYLLELRHILLKELEQRERTDWFRDEMCRRVMPARLSVPREQAYKRIAGWGRLDGEAREILRNLAILREELAETNNKPIQHIMDDKMLLGLARIAPRDTKGLAQNRRLHKGLIRRHGERILDAIERGKSADPGDYPEAAPPPLTRDQDSILDFLKPILRIYCRNNDVASDLVAPKKLLLDIVRGSNDDFDTIQGSLHGWRRDLLSEIIYGLMSGNSALRYDPKRRRVEIFPLESGKK